MIDQKNASNQDKDLYFIILPIVNKKNVLGLFVFYIKIIKKSFDFINIILGENLYFRRYIKRENE